MAWIPQAAFDLRTDGSAGFAKFSTYDGRNQPVEIDSLHKLRQVERESEQLARDGEGQQIVFRAFSQSRGNRLDGTLGTTPEASKPSAEAKRKFGLQGGARPLAPTTSGEPDVAFGPGVTEANASALKE